MPEATENLTPRGQAYGAKTEQESFVQAANAAAPTPNPVVPVVPQAYQSTVEVQEEPDPEVETPNIVELEDGPLDMNEILLRGTQRPDEPVTAGLPGYGSAQSVSGVLEGLVRKGFSTPDVQSLLTIARNLGL